MRHIEGVTLGFLVLRNPDGKALAYGDWKQVVKPDGLVVDDLQFQFKDGSFYEEVTKFTQRGKFRLVSDQVKQNSANSREGQRQDDDHAPRTAGRCLKWVALCTLEERGPLGRDDSVVRSGIHEATSCKVEYLS